MTDAVTVVVAEDEAIIRMDLVEVLREEGYAVVADTGRGDDAVRLVTEHRPDLALLDIKMPGVDGFGVLERLEMYPTSALSRMTVFMLSATLDPDELRRAEGHPIVEALLPKPLDIHQLRGWMEQVGR